MLPLSLLYQTDVFLIWYIPQRDTTDVQRDRHDLDLHFRLLTEERLKMKNFLLSILIITAVVISGHVEAKEERESDTPDMEDMNDSEFAVETYEEESQHSVPHLEGIWQLQRNSLKCEKHVSVSDIKNVALPTLDFLPVPLKESSKRRFDVTVEAINEIDFILEFEKNEWTTELPEDVDGWRKEIHTVEDCLLKIMTNPDSLTVDEGQLNIRNGELLSSWTRSDL